MSITGEMLIGRKAVRGEEKPLRAFNPATGADIAEPVFGSGSVANVELACELAQKAFDPYRHLPLTVRAEFLERIADGITALGDALIQRAHEESGLPKARLEGERGRTTGQLKLFAQIVRAGHWLAATLDSPLPERKPLPRSDLRMQKIPLGPVAVFGASNFPLAFSVAGGDTAAALAAGCPVVVKAHRAHLGTSEMVGRVIQQVAQDMDLPEGVFSMIVGAGNSVGEALVAHPAIKAVGFTGSRAGGTSLMRVAAARAEPIPVYAEMSSINPVFLLSNALSQRGETIARGFVDSLVLGAGQFCTNPGLAIAIDSDALKGFVATASEALSGKPAQTMLTAGIHAAYEEGEDKLAATRGVEAVARGIDATGPTQACAALFVTDAQTFLSTPALEDEVFGPASTIVRCKDEQELLAVAEHFDGQLTATVQMDIADLAAAKKLVPILERKAGRILVNGFPTGVEVSHAMVHGGPFPATSDSRATSVGTTSIERFLRPVCYQDFPADLLPEALADANPLDLWRRRDGEITRS
ncbi:Alpha-ketoglutaric semialdehyde dehydrogenase 2 [Paraburkholderia aspalathi]|uniref:Alpha-ketoglutaric semialdehyde dehydrogenase 2 n=1 Tax=Paraburkholderia aspalathi TaxID=1324617 RepID=A0ABM8T0T5_9BURK|nr:aldehyde dehydrogenase (NADP(+)) [Paraburkholderia aspalathi]MBK3823359.1 aldehyde dehydrogenase (NADP(+)) [Paraburkholderia aspalathi]MBK3835190.1 aldehyde dehydrogenase (NADP(+)) [Paraburkholderia aspalathi]MBK3864908.1 aldehyde dehydrogenase (NADP(+)) [Paraburkholderia aspalathi]CAE6847439.1 Alpha-ketoglutaric semialdehyde dehydrogenase 2 [Paraburkholderia aspalathi]